VFPKFMSLIMPLVVDEWLIVSFCSQLISDGDHHKEFKMKIYNFIFTHKKKKKGLCYIHSPLLLLHFPSLSKFFSKISCISETNTLPLCFLPSAKSTWQHDECRKIMFAHSTDENKSLLVFQLISKYELYVPI